MAAPDAAAAAFAAATAAAAEAAALFACRPALSPARHTQKYQHPFAVATGDKTQHITIVMIKPVVIVAIIGR